MVELEMIEADGVMVEFMNIEEDGARVELVKKEEDGARVELMKMGTDVVFTDEYTGLIEVMEFNIVVVRLTLSTDLEEVAIKLLL